MFHFTDLIFLNKFFSGFLFFYLQPHFGLQILRLLSKPNQNPPGPLPMNDLREPIALTNTPEYTTESPTPDNSLDYSTVPPNLNNSPDYTTESPKNQIPAPPISIGFQAYSCIWLTDFYLCYEEGSNYCIFIFGSRPETSFVLTQTLDTVPETSDTKYYIERFCTRKELVMLVGSKC